MVKPEAFKLLLSELTKKILYPKKEI